MWAAHNVYEGCSACLRCDGDACNCCQRLFEAADVEYTDFIRTSEKHHQHTVHHFWVAFLFCWIFVLLYLDICIKVSFLLPDVRPYAKPLVVCKDKCLIQEPTKVSLRRALGSGLT